MPRKKLTRTNVYPYHLYARTNKKEYFKASLYDVWSIYCDLLFIIHLIYKCRIHAFVLMSNHFHLVLSTPLENLDDAMMYFMRESSREINKLLKQNSRVYSGRYKWSLINNERYYHIILKYVYQNPIKANICLKVEEYPFSSIRMKLGLSNWKIPLSPMFDDSSYLNHPFYLRNYCNQILTNEIAEVINKGLRKPEFQVGKRISRKEKNDIELEEAVGRKK